LLVPGLFDFTNRSLLQIQATLFDTSPQYTDINTIVKILLILICIMPLSLSRI
jgi:hypothetical protein